jgi:hypothetical protein
VIFFLRVYLANEAEKWEYQVKIAKLDQSDEDMTERLITDM